MHDSNRQMQLASELRGWMKEALREARHAMSHGDVPVGAVVVKDGRIIGKGHNSRELLRDATAHAEMIAITAACESIGNWRLDGCDIFVTLEPCPMCASAIQQARIKRIVFGAYERSMGACESLMNLPGDRRFGRPVEIIAPVLEEECTTLLAEFFLTVRSKDKGET